MADSGLGSGEGDSPVQSKGNGGAIREKPVKVLPCPRCQSMNTKFCYYNNYNVNQPRHFCRNCQRYWTVGGTLRNVPVGGGSRKKLRMARSRTDPYLRAGEAPQTGPLSSMSGADGLLGASTCVQQLPMLPSTPGLVCFGTQLSGFAPAGSQLPFVQTALEQSQSMYTRVQQKPLAGLQEVPDLQPVYDVPQVPQFPQVGSELLNMSSLMMDDGFLKMPGDLHLPSDSEALASVITKADLWSNPMQQLSSLNGSTWEDSRPSKSSFTSQLQNLSGYEDRRNPMNQVNVNMFLPNTKPQFWGSAIMNQKSLMDDRLVPHTSWDENQSTQTSLSPTESSSLEEERSLPNYFSSQYEDVPQSWAGLLASDILF